MIRAVIFDCFGVLYGSALQTLRSLTPADQLDELDNLTKLSDYGYLSRADFNSRVGEIVNRSPSEVDEIIADRRQRNPDLVAYVSDLRRRGYKTGLLSNIGSEVVDRLFSASEQAELFDTVVLSYAVELRKPDDRIYLLTAERLGVAPEECVMIDDMQSNCDGAEVTGMRAICHQSNDDTKKSLELLLND